ncbi:hypothetical protein Q1695_014913 [Nippostrongylus brasiliensis]|nr:hypothetical protein Q1695_014913 [Nippostrongylus brasiliensis]
MIFKQLLLPFGVEFIGSFLLDVLGHLMTSSKPDVRFLVTVLVAITFGLFLIVLSTGLHRPLLPYDPLLWLFTLYIVMCYQWNRLFGAYLTRTQRATFDEWNIMETYQPRALTMGHLFDPEPPTPFPGEAEQSNPQLDRFRAMRDAHYANEYTIVEQMAKERKLMEGTGKDASAATKSQPKPAEDVEVMRIELKPDSKNDDQSSLREI